MNLLKTVNAALQEDDKSFTWLAEKMERTPEGLKGGLQTESMKYRDLKKLALVLKRPIQFFFGEVTIQNIHGRHNEQSAHDHILYESEGEYHRKEVEQLRRQIDLLEAQLRDKEHIITLLKDMR